MNWKRFAVPVMFLTTLALPGQLLAQHTRYKIIDLGTLGGTNSYQVAPGRTVNNRGEIIAFSDTNVPDPYTPNCLQPDCLISHAIKWREGVPTDLGALPGVNDSIPGPITSNGLIAGTSENGEIDPETGFPEVRAVFWNEDGTIKDLGTFGGNFSQAFGANSRGQVVGVAANTIPDPFALIMEFLPAATQARAFLWQNGFMHDLGTLGSGNDAAHRSAGSDRHSRPGRAAAPSPNQSDSSLAGQRPPTAKQSARAVRPGGPGSLL